MLPRARHPAQCTGLGAVPLRQLALPANLAMVDTRSILVLRWLAKDGQPYGMPTTPSTAHSQR